MFFSAYVYEALFLSVFLMLIFYTHNFFLEFGMPTFACLCILITRMVYYCENYTCYLLCVRHACTYDLFTYVVYWFKNQISVYYCTANFDFEIDRIMYNVDTKRNHIFVLFASSNWTRLLMRNVQTALESSNKNTIMLEVRNQVSKYELEYKISSSYKSYMVWAGPWWYMHIAHTQTGKRTT